MASPIRLDFVTLDVFTSSPFLGNPLAVVLVPASLGSRITDAIRQRIACEFNLSETVFLHTLDKEPQTDATARSVSIFTVEKELPFAGHPTIGTAYLVLKHLGWSHVDTLVTKAGPIRIAPRTGGAPGVLAAIPHDVHIHRNTLRSVLSTARDAELRTVIEAGLSPDADVRAAELDAPAVSIVKGMTFLLVKLSSLEQLARVTASKRLDFDAIPNLLDAGPWEESFTSRYYYVPSEGPPSADGLGHRTHSIRTRMVELGFEDPATGSAACTLASYLTLTAKTAEQHVFDITQGVEMGRRSDISVRTTAEATADGAVQIKELFLGGEAVVVMSGSISVQA